MDIFCPKFSKCEAPISVIAKIMANKDSQKFKEILNQFFSLGFYKVKDLAQTTLGNASKMTIDGDPIAKLYEAIRVYDQLCDRKLKTAKYAFNQNNFNKSLELSKKICEFHPTSIIGLHLLASSYFYCEYYDNCIKHLIELLKQYPNCAEAFNNFGLCYMKKSQFEDALKYFHKAVFCKPDEIIYMMNYGQALTKVDPPKAIEYFEQIIKQHSKFYLIRYNYGHILLSLNKVDEAIQQFETFNKNVPNILNSWLSLGDVYSSINKLNKAIICYENGLKINPSKTTWINLGITYMMLNDYLNAINSFEAVLKLCPNDVLALDNLGQVYCHQKNIPLAIATYKTCLRLQPNNLNCNLNLGILYFQFLKSNQEAEKLLKKCLDLKPQKELEIIYKNLSTVYELQGKYKNASEIYMLLADMYFEEDNQSDARNVYIRLLQLDPENPYGHWKLGLTYYKMGLSDLALMRYKYALELKPNFANAYCDAAIIFEEKNRSDFAIQYYETALKFEPNHYNVLYNLILLKEKLGLLDDLIDLYNKMLNHENSDNFEVYGELGNVYHKKGNLDEAYSCYLKAKDIKNTVETNILIGNVLIEMKKNDDALIYYNKAIELDPQCYIAYNNIGSIFKDNKNIADAIDMFEMVLKIKPDYPDAQCNLAQCLQQRENNKN